MTYNTTPITSGAAKFSTLDPDAPLFLQENNITRGADPEDPITFYNQQTGELNAVNSIITSAGELTLNNSDLIGVKRFICQDYLGTVLTTASANTHYTAILQDVTRSNTSGTSYSSLVIRIPSNVVSVSSISLTYSGKWLSGSSAPRIGIAKKNTNGTYTSKAEHAISAVGVTDTFTDTITNVSGGEYYTIYVKLNSSLSSGTAFGSAGVAVAYDLTTYPDPILWDVVTP